MLTLATMRPLSPMATGVPMGATVLAAQCRTVRMKKGGTRCQCNGKFAKKASCK